LVVQQDLVSLIVQSSETREYGTEVGEGVYLSLCTFQDSAEYSLFYMALLQKRPLILSREYSTEVGESVSSSLCTFQDSLSPTTLLTVSLVSKMRKCAFS